jgi:uncharacterized coiled-coil protein SlyX
VVPTERRFALLEKRVSRIVETEADMSELIARMDQRFDALNDKLDRRFEVVDEKVDRRFDVLDARLAHQFDVFDTRLSHRFDVLDARLSRQFMWLVGLQVTILLAVIAALVAH